MRRALAVRFLVWRVRLYCSALRLLDRIIGAALPPCVRALAVVLAFAARLAAPQPGGPKP